MPSVSGKVINQKRERRVGRHNEGGASRTFAGSSCKEEPWQTETLPSAVCAHTRVTGTVSEGRECQEREMPKAWSGRGARVRRRRTRVALSALCTLAPRPTGARHVHHAQGDLRPPRGRAAVHVGAAAHLQGDRPSRQPSSPPVEVTLSVVHVACTSWARSQSAESAAAARRRRTRAERCARSWERRSRVAWRVRARVYAVRVLGRPTEDGPRRAVRLSFPQWLIFKMSSDVRSPRNTSRRNWVELGGLVVLLTLACCVASCLATRLNAASMGPRGRFKSNPDIPRD